jgi:transposase-like protein
MAFEETRKKSPATVRVKARFSPKQILAFLRSVDEGRERSIVHACERIGISRQTYYHWRQRYGRVADQGRMVMQLEEDLRSLSERLAAQQQMLRVLRAQMVSASIGGGESTRRRATLGMRRT